VSSVLFYQCVFGSVLKELCLIYYRASGLLSSGISVEVQFLYLQETDTCHGRFRFSFSAQYCYSLISFAGFCISIRVLL